MNIDVFFSCTLHLKHFSKFDSFWSQRINNCWGISIWWFTFLLLKKSRIILQKYLCIIFISLHKNYWRLKLLIYLVFNHKGLYLRYGNMRRKYSFLGKKSMHFTFLLHLWNVDVLMGSRTLKYIYLKYILINILLYIQYLIMPAFTCLLNIHLLILFFIP